MKDMDKMLKRSGREIVSSAVIHLLTKEHKLPSDREAVDILDEFARVIDFRVWNQGASVLMVELASKAAREWVKENVETEGWQWIGNSIAVEPRYLENLISGMEAAGLQGRY